MPDTFLSEFQPSVADDRILISNHGLPDGTVIHFKLGTPSNILPAPLVVDQDYYVVQKRLNDFKVSATLAGAPVNIIDVGSGTNDVWLKGAATEPIPEVTDYTVVVAISGDDLAAQVKALCQMGWIPQGGPFAFNYRPGQPNTPQPSQFFGQALIKR